MPCRRVGGHVGGVHDDGRLGLPGEGRSERSGEHRHRPQDRERIFRAFWSRGGGGGTGLGLAIARDIARSHGGDIILSDSPLGGLRATVRVPI